MTLSEFESTRNTNHWTLVFFSSHSEQSDAKFKEFTLYLESEKQKLGTQFTDQIKFAILDTDKYPQVLKQFKIKEIPKVVLFLSNHK
jgi:thioredoxin-like negative regulator of GroEL